MQVQIPTLKHMHLDLLQLLLWNNFLFTSVDSTRVVKDSFTGQIFIEGKTRVLSAVRLHISGNMINKNSEVQNELKKKMC